MGSGAAGQHTIEQCSVQQGFPPSQSVGTMVGAAVSTLAALSMESGKGTQTMKALDTID